MNASADQPGLVDVSFAKPLRVRSVQDVLVTCLSGIAWVTRDGDCHDVILSEGEALRVSMHEDTLIVAMPECKVRIAAAPR